MSLASGGLLVGGTCGAQFGYLSQNTGGIGVHTSTHFYIPSSPISHFSSHFIAAFSVLGLSPPQLVHVFSVPNGMTPRNGSGQVATSDFDLALAVGDSQDGRGYVALGPNSKILPKGR